MFVKICGLRRAEEVTTAVHAGADAIGFMFTASPRQVHPADVAPLVAAAGEALTVGVFTTESHDTIADIVATTKITGVQLHGAGHSPREFAALRELPVRTIRAGAAGALDTVCGSHGEDLLIVDAPRPGSGHSWDYSAVRGDPTGQWMLAGGLSPDNVAQAIAAARPWGVDVSSGVEKQRGTKDLGLIREFITAAKARG